MSLRAHALALTLLAPFAAGQSRRQAWIGWASIAGVAIVSVIGAEMAAHSSASGLGL